jgi:putative addiction module CopG family antidote
MEIGNLPPELVRFAAEPVAAGRYRDVSEVVAAGISILRRTEDARATLLESVQLAERNGGLNGFLSLDEICDDSDAVVAQIAGR